MEHELKRLIDMMFSSYNEEQKKSFLIHASAVAFSLKPSEYDLKRMRMAVATWYNSEIKSSGFVLDLSSEHNAVILNSNRALWIKYDEAWGTLIDLHNAAVNADENKLRKIWEMMA